jgi:uncharacterized RDD family membrane protein YckC
MVGPRPNPERDPQENEPERSSRLYAFIILGIIVATLAIFVALSHPARQSTGPIPTRTSMILTDPGLCGGAQRV